MLYIFTEVLWRKMIQLLSNKTTPHFQPLPMSKCIMYGVYLFTKFLLTQILEILMVNKLL